MFGNDRPALSFRGGAQRLRAGMRQRRQLGKRRANATMVSRLAAEPGGHWEKSSQRAIFPNGLALGDVAAERAEFYRQDRIFFVMKMLRLKLKKAMIA